MALRDRICWTCGALRTVGGPRCGVLCTRMIHRWKAELKRFRMIYGSIGYRPCALDPHRSEVRHWDFSSSYAFAELLRLRDTSARVVRFRADVGCRLKHNQFILPPVSDCPVDERLKEGSPLATSKGTTASTRAARSRLA